MSEHEISIPGLDYSLCAKCHKWIIEDTELGRLKDRLMNSKKGTLTASKREFQKYVKQVIKDKKECVATSD